MRTVLLVLDSEDLRNDLHRALKSDHEVFICAPVEVRSQLLCRRVDALILDLYLPGIDGLTVLKCIQDIRPPVILMLTKFVSPYISQTAADLGVGFIARIPCSVSAIITHLRELLQNIVPSPRSDVYTKTLLHLSRLWLDNTSKGFRRLCVGIPLFVQDPEQSFTKELYPAIGKISGCSWKAAERSIRNAIIQAWEMRDIAVWEEYFPGFTECPTNAQFFAALEKKVRK